MTNSMRRHIHRALPGASALILLIGLFSCSGSDSNDDGGSSADAAPADAGPSLPDGFVVWPCDEPGKSCNAHDPCAVDPVCSPDNKCIPSRFQLCDDKLECTQDTCQGLGLCENTPKEGSCALPVKVPAATDGGVPKTEIRCFQKDERHPDDACLLCDPDTDPKHWTPANGGACDDGDPCTKDDYCQQGSCKGVYFGTQCADEYGCTEDLCDGKGGCLGNALRPDWCLINGACHKDQSPNPSGACSICDVATSQSAWTPVTDTCMIDNKCYAKGATNAGGCGTCDPSVASDKWTVKGDVCLINGICKKPGDTDSIKCSSCDPATDKYAWTPLSGRCKIDGKCYQQGESITGGCAECDTAVNTTGWTVKGDVCLIDGSCKKPGDTDSIQCSSCDPATDKYAWTPLTGKCKIAGACHADQATDTTGCLMCDTSKSTSEWTPVAGALSQAYTFESGKADGWTLTSVDNSVKWQVASKKASGGTYALYYGDPVAGNYNSGAKNSGTATMPAVQLTAGKKAGLTFMLYMDVEKSTSYDKFKIYVGSTVVWTKNSPTTNVTMKTWQPVTIDLSSYAGQSVTIKFEFDTSDSISNSTEGIYLDDVTIFHSC